MSKNEEQKVSRVKGKKRAWFKIIGPSLFHHQELGESFLSSGSQGIGRTVGVNLKELTGNVKDQNASVSFRITTLDKGTLQTIPIGYRLSPAFIRRVVKKNVNRIDGYVTGSTQDHQKVIIKTLFITWRKTNRSARALLQKKATEYLQEELGKGTFSDFLGNVVGQRVQQALRKQLQVVYPLREAALRVIQLQEKEAGERAEIGREEAPPVPEAESLPSEPISSPEAVPEEAVPEEESAPPA